MLHELAFADANRPAPVQVLRLALKPYSLGHDLRLRALRNALVLLPPEEFNAIPTAQKIAALKAAVMICELDEAQTARLEKPSWFNWRVRWHGFKLKLAWWRINANEYPLGIAEFRNYHRAGTLCPYLIPHREPGRQMGGPLVARLIQFVAEHFGKSEREALDYPYGAACWHYFVWNEGQGNVNIINQDELDFEEYCAAEEAKLSQQPPTPTNPAPNPVPVTPGLATPAPDLSAADSEVRHA